MQAPLSAWLTWLQATSLASAVRGSSWLYPAIETFHIGGIVILVGSVAMFDLRLLGFGRTVALRPLADHLLSWSRGALLVVIPTGLAMFSAHAVDWAVNPAFRVKLALICAAGINALVFHLGIFRSVATWENDSPSPLAARFAAILSISLWAGVIVCGRLLAFV